MPLRQLRLTPDLVTRLPPHDGVSGLVDTRGDRPSNADSGAAAAGERGAMAGYLHSTISHLKARGIHDRHLWRLQDPVAARIAALYPAP